MRFPGTITVPEDVFRRLLESAARSARLHGFRNVVFLGDHGSTQVGEKMVAARLNREWAATPVRAHAIEEYYHAATAGIRRPLLPRGQPAPGSRGPARPPRNPPPPPPRSHPLRPRRFPR